jgi:putative two-component system response regulator
MASNTAADAKKGQTGYEPGALEVRVVGSPAAGRPRDSLCQLRQTDVRSRIQARIDSCTIFDHLVSLAETWDNKFEGHIARTQKYVKALTLELRKSQVFKEELDDDSVDLIYKSSLLHDIGKAAIPCFILLKPGKLSAGEFNIMKKHTEYGRNAMMKARTYLAVPSERPLFCCAEQMAYSHHERWNGEGYPEMLAGEDIPLCGRIMAVADVYDALVSKRVYKPPFPHRKALSVMEKGRGVHFDPRILDAFMSVEEEIRSVAMTF